jgi:hypothetical protein
MFNAGSVYGQAILDIRDWMENADKMEKKHESLTGSVFKAEVAFEAFKKGLEVVVDVVKDSIKAYMEAEKAEAQMNAVLKSTGGVAGMTAQALTNLAEELSNVSTFSKDTIIASENLLLTFTKIGKDIFPEAQKAILDVSTALGQDLKSSSIQIGKALNDPIVGLTALKRVGVSFTESQVEMIKQLQKSGDLMGAQKVILKELETEFGGSADAISKTFGGTLARINNKMEETRETIGGFAVIALKPLADEFLKASISFNEFLNKSETMDKVVKIMANLSGAFNTFKVIITDLISGAWKTISTEIVKVQESFGKLFDTVGGKKIDGFTILAAIVRNISMGFEISIKMVSSFIQAIVDLSAAIIETGKISGIFFQALSDPTKWGDFFKQVDKAKGAFVNFGKNVYANGKDIITTVIKDFATYPAEVEALTVKMQKSFSTGYDKIIQSSKKAGAEVVANTKDAGNEVSKVWVNQFGSMGEAWHKATEDWKKAVESKDMPAMRNAAGAMAQTILQGVQTGLSAAKNLYDGIMGAVLDSMNNELSALKAKNEEKVQVIQDAKDNELQSNQDKYDQDLTSLDDSLSQGIITQTQYDAQKKALDKKKADDEKKITTEKDAALKAQKNQNLKEENEQNKKIFEANKANQIAQVWIQFALGTVSAFAMGISQLGPIAGAVIGGIMTAALLAVAIAQTVVISQQQFIPAKATGGMAGGSTRVNEQGGEIITLPDGSQVVPNDISQQIAKNAGSVKNNNISVSFAGANINSNMDLKKVADYVIDEIGRRVG